MNEILPTVGRMVYYKTRGSLDGMYPPTDFAAIVTAVHLGASPTLVSLCTFGETGLRFERNVEKGDQPGQWDWMPFQKDQMARLAQGTANESHSGPQTETPVQN